MAPQVDIRLYYVLPLTVVRRTAFIHQLTRGLGFPLSAAIIAFPAAPSKPASY